MIVFLAAAILGYLLGSIPFGLVLTRLAGQGDIRRMGSGNIGATNVLRTGSKGLAALTLLFDVGKGFAAAAIAQRWAPQAALVAGLCAILGHMFPVWLGFRGGKGVATALGVLMALAWPVALVAAIDLARCRLLLPLFLAGGADRFGRQRRYCTFSRRPGDGPSDRDDRAAAHLAAPR